MDDHLGRDIRHDDLYEELAPTTHCKFSKKNALSQSPALQIFLDSGHGGAWKRETLEAAWPPWWLLTLMRYNNHLVWPRWKILRSFCRGAELEQSWNSRGTLVRQAVNVSRTTEDMHWMSIQNHPVKKGCLSHLSYLSCLHLHLSISIYIYLYLSISIYIYLYLSISIYIYLYLSISIYICLYLSISIYLYICISINL